MLVAYLLFYLVTRSNGQSFCESAPDDGIRNFCYQIQEMDRMNRLLEAAGSSTFGRVINFRPQTVYDCRNIPCICSFLGGDMRGGSCRLRNGQTFGKALRKEFRMLTDEEMRRFISAMWTIKSSGTYDVLARVHTRFASGTGAHAGPAFLGWHREFIKRLELALRQVDPTVALPYWDSTLDANIPNPRHSVIWSDDLLGGAMPGEVRDGVFGGWLLDNRTRVIRRNVGAAGRPYNDSIIDATLNTNSLTTILAYTAATDSCPVLRTFFALEFTHGNPHNFVGEDMVFTASSANDPIFFLHHSFVDSVWEMWRRRAQPRQSREDNYPPDDILCSSSFHFRNAPMMPFQPLLNIDGLSHEYTDNLYDYSPRPSCSFRSPDCGSRYLFCDLSHGSPRCASRIMMGGDCSGFFRGESSCYIGDCMNGVCRFVGARMKEQGSINELANPAPALGQKLITPAPAGNGSCLNDQECCDVWAARGSCQENTAYMSSFCKASCNICTPSHDKSVECSDRFSSCSRISNECMSRTAWMRENCRRTCDYCTETRQESCTTISIPYPSSAARNESHTSKATGGASANGSASYQESKFPVLPPPQQSVAPCFNLHFCCSIWAQNNRCGDGTIKQFCPVSCNSCGNVDLLDRVESTGCTDYHSKCVTWASSNMCETKKKFMWENCKLSCRKCDLLDMDKRMTACQNELPVSEKELPEKLAAARPFSSQPPQNTEESIQNCTNY